VPHTPDQMDEELAYRIGRAFARVLSNLEDTPIEEVKVAVGRHEAVALLARRQIRTQALVRLKLAHVAAQGLGRHTTVPGHMRDRLARLDHDPRAAIKQLWGVLPRTSYGDGASPLPRTESSLRGLRQTQPGSRGAQRVHAVRRARPASRGSPACGPRGSSRT
jgi:hypothetical protein